MSEVPGTVTHGGLVRSYIFSSPSSLPQVSMGLVIAMHGYTGTSTLNSFFNLHIAAFEHSMCVVEPQGNNNAWNVGA